MCIRDREETLLLRITHSLGEEKYRITAGKKEMLLEGGDELGISYALLFLSEKFLGVKPFWYWLDQNFVKRKQAEIPEGMYLSPSYACLLYTSFQLSAVVRYPNRL